MPFSKSDFDEDKRDKYKAAIASAAGAPVDNVDIVSITEKRRRAGSVDVETMVLWLLPPTSREWLLRGGSGGCSRACHLPAPTQHSSLYRISLWRCLLLVTACRGTP